MVAMKGNTEVRYTEHAWGACFTGTKKALIQAGLIDEKHIPRKWGKEITYQLPLNWSDGYNDACYGSGGAIPPRWDATATLSDDDPGVINVKVNHEWDQLDVRPRIELALKALTELRSLIEGISPRPLGKLLQEWIGKAQSFPSNTERRQSNQAKDAEREMERQDKRFVFAVDRKPAKGSRRQANGGQDG